jgi:nucleosome binding factor SPN SPT16 subunit
MRAVSASTSKVMDKYFIPEMEGILEDEKKITHEKLAEKTETCIYDENLRQKLISSDMSGDLLDWAYTPIIQSGGEYDLKPSAVSNDKQLHRGAIICSLGLRYRNYCANIGRTFLIDPSKKQEENYNFLLELQSYVVSQMNDGILISDLYAKAREYISEKRPDLENHFVKNIGFVTGIEFRESSFVIGPKTQRPLKTGMTVNLVLGFQSLEDKNIKDKIKTYALLIADIVAVGPVGEPAAFLTTTGRKFTEISYSFDVCEHALVK